MSGAALGRPASRLYRTGKPSLPGCRDTEWLSAIAMCAWAAILALPGDGLAGPSFSAFHHLALTKTFWACAFGGTGGLRLGALYINGRSPRTPYARMIGAFLGFLGWGQVACLVAEGTVATLGVVPPGIAAYGVLALAELRSSTGRATMPDMSAADLAAIAGTFLAAVITGLGLRRGEAEKKGLPAADASLAAGVFVGMDAETVRALLDEVRDLHADLAAWRHEDEIERRVDRDRSTDERFEAIEGNQATILGLLRRMEGR